MYLSVLKLGDTPFIEHNINRNTPLKKLYFFVSKKILRVEILCGCY